MYEYSKIEELLKEISGESKFTQKYLRELFGVSTKEIRNAISTGLVDSYTADKMCVALGSHPANVFGFDKWVTEGLE